MSILKPATRIMLRDFLLDPTTPERFWLNHGVSKAHPLSEGLETVRKYLSNTQDIVLFRVSTNQFGLSKGFPQEQVSQLKGCFWRVSVPVYLALLPLAGSDTHPMQHLSLQAFHRKLKRSLTLCWRKLLGIGGSSPTQVAATQ